MLDMVDSTDFSLTRTELSLLHKCIGVVLNRLRIGAAAKEKLILPNLMVYVDSGDRLSEYYTTGSEMEILWIYRSNSSPKPTAVSPTTTVSA